MQEQFSRSAMLIGEEGVARLHAKRVAVFGVGGVGGAAAEALARSGIGHLDLVDGDTVSFSNLNRQVVALTDTVGQYKAEVMAARAAKANPRIQVTARSVYYTPDTAGTFCIVQYDYVLDCVDMVTAKLLLVQQCHALHVPIISAMGAGNRLDPTQVRVDDIAGTRMCPLARVMRKQLKQRGVDRLTVAWSPEEPLKPRWQHTADGRHPPGSMAFVPAAMGIAMAAHVVRALLAEEP